MRRSQQRRPACRQDVYRQRFARLVVEALEDRTTPTTFASAGFSDVLMATGLSNNTAMDFSPTGELWVVEEDSGLIKMVRNNGTVLTVNRDAGGTATPIALNTSGERGLLGLAFPNAATGIGYDGLGPNTDFAYVYYTKPTTGTAPFDAIELRHNRVSRFTVMGAGTNDPRIDLASEQVILDIEPENEDNQMDEDGDDNHNGGAIHFSPNGKLFVSIGDHNYDSVSGANHVSQVLTSRFGKLLRLDPDGTNPNDNPFYDGNETNARGAIWALGLRNPFTFNIHPTTGRIYVNDVGEGPNNRWEEVNDVGDADTPPTSTTAFNGGWAGSSSVSAEGFEVIPFTGFVISNGTYTNPIEAYGPSIVSGNAITGSTFYAPTNNQFGAGYLDRYFFSDWTGRWIRLLDPGTPGSVADPSNSAAFADALDGTGPVDQVVDSAGNLYYSARNSGQIRRISRSGAEIAANFSGTNLADNDTSPSAGEGTDFGNVTVGNFVERTFTISNSGTSTLHLGTVFVGGAGFTLQTPPALTIIPASGSTTFTVRFTPGGAGAASGRVYFQNNDSVDATNEAFFNFDVIGNGALPATPEITVTGLANDVADGSAASAANGSAFGNLLVGATMDRTFTVTNSGSATLTLTIAAGSVTGIGFTLQSGAGTFNLAPAATTDFVVRFAPAATGAASGAVSFVTNDGDENPFNFSLSGTGMAPEIGVTGLGNNVADGSAASASNGSAFGDVTVGSNLDRTFTITNSGSATLTLTLAAGSVTGTGFTLQSGAGTFNLAPAGTTNFVVRFAPSSTGSATGTVSFVTNDGDENPFNFSLSGNGTVALLPEITVTGLANDVADGSAASAANGSAFGDVIVGNTLNNTFTITNNGTANLTLTLAAGSVTGAGFSLLSGAGTFSLTPGSTTNFVVRFTPGVTGAATGAVSFVTNDGDENPFNFNLSAAGVAPEITVTGLGNDVADGSAASAANGSAFGNVNLGGTLDRTFTVANNGTADLTLTIDAGSVTGTGFSMQSGAGTFNLTPGGTTDFVVRFAPVSAGPVSGTISFVTNDGNENPFNFSLAGTGAVPPTATITAPDLFSFGQDIQFSGAASDPEDGTLPASAFSWRVDFGHDTHFHEGHHSATGVRSSSFVADVDERDPDQFYRVILTVTDADGNTFTTFRDVLPRLSQITIATLPIGLEASIDTTTGIGPFTVDSVVGMPHNLFAAATQTLDGRTYTFVSWSDDGAASHQIFTPAQAVTYTAEYWTPTATRVGVFRGGAGTLDGSGNGRFGTGDWRIPRFDGTAGKPLVGDWNGDDIDEVGVFRANRGRFTLDLNGNGVYDGTPTDARYTRLDGRTGGTPLVGDWDGDGDDDVGLFRALTRTFRLYVDGTLLRTITGLGTGSRGNQPLVGDWNGDGADSIGLFRAVSGVFTLDYLGDQSTIRTITNFDGSPGGRAVVGDWDGDGAESIGLFRAGTGTWALDVNGDFDPGADLQFTRLDGQARGTPLVGDWDGDGDSETGIYRGRNGRFTLDLNGDGIFDESAGDLRFARLRNQTGGKPVVGRWGLGPVS